MYLMFMPPTLDLDNPVSKLAHLIAGRMGITLPQGFRVAVGSTQGPEAGYYYYTLNTLVVDGLIASKERLVEIIAHELVHCDQQQRGDMQIVRDELHWKGHPCGTYWGEYKVRTQEQYERLPWEFEANSRAAAFRQFVYPNCPELKEVA